MGGKSSKGSKDKVKQQNGNSKNSSNNNSKNGRSGGRNTAKEAWEKPVRNGKTKNNKNNNNGSSSVKNRLKDANDTWGVTTYNLLDLEMGNGGGGGGGKFGQFRDITADRNLEDSERKRQEYNANRIKGQQRSASPVKKSSWSSSPTRLSPRKKGFNSAPVEANRRYSDVSTIDMREDKGGGNFGNFSSGNTKMVRNEAIGGANRANNNKRAADNRRAHSSSPPRRRSPPNRVQPNHNRNSNNNSRNRTSNNNNRGRSGPPAFTNIANVRSASQSVSSNVSNFNSSSKVEKFNDKRDSLADNRLSKIQGLRNQFRDQRVTGVDSYDRAKADMAHEDWENEVKGVEMVVNIARQKPEILRGDMKNVIRLMMEELKNLRSQVCRAAGQAFGELYLNLGKAMETDLEKQTTLLLQKAADTNKFIRESCNEALDVMCENVSVFSAVSCVLAGGGNHKSVVVRTNVARILDNVVSALGADRFMGCSRELQEMVIKHGGKSVTDAALEVRQHTKHMFSVLASHSKFESTVRQFIKSDKEVDAIKKAAK